MIGFKEFVYFVFLLYRQFFTGLFRRKTPTIELPSCYRSETCSNIHILPEDILNDVKYQTYYKLRSNIKLMNKASRVGFIIVDFYRRVPISMPSVKISHMFYWNGECLYSSTQETTAVIRDIKIKQILN